MSFILENLGAKASHDAFHATGSTLKSGNEPRPDSSDSPADRSKLGGTKSIRQGYCGSSDVNDRLLWLAAMLVRDELGLK